MDRKKLHIAIPLMDELDNLPMLLGNLKVQEEVDFHVYFCVNQPESWWNDPGRIAVCERNLESISFLKHEKSIPISVIDRASKGNGWKGKDLGVGWARKVVMDTVLDQADPEDIIITLDGDTAFNPKYFRSVLNNFNKNQDAVGLSVPYYHKLSGSDAEDRAILRYEIYMRSYAINLWRIQNPYHFTALGSAMAVPVSAYRAIGGMSPKKSGEDFYFLQKLVKYGRLLTWNEEKVYPAARFSDRVFFGTGPAMIKGAGGNWESYPVYHHSLFEDIYKTYGAFGKIFDHNVETPLDNFITQIWKGADIWSPLRKNARTIEQFKRACRDKVDGLRILQYLKLMQMDNAYRDEDCLLENLDIFFPARDHLLGFLSPGFNFDDLNVEQLDMIRNTLAALEEEYQKSHHHG